MMSILMEVLAEELDRLDRQEASYKKALLEVPKGYISRKTIKGRVYHYLQHKENGKVVGEYIRAADLPAVEAQVHRRQQLEASLRRVKADREKLRKILGEKHE